MNKADVRARLVVLLTGLTFATAPALAVAPEGWSIAFGNVSSQMMDCIRFRPCTSSSCRAVAIYSGAVGRCTRAQEFEPGRTRMSCTFKDIEWSFWANPAKEMILDVTCTRLGETQYHLGGKYTAAPPLSCSANVALLKMKHYWPYTKNVSEGYFGLAVGKRLSCRRRFGKTLTDAEWREIRLEWMAD